MMPPRAQLMRYTPSFIPASVSALIILRVWSISGIWTVMKSDRAKSSSCSSNSTCNSRALLSDRNGSYVSTRMPKAIARRATCAPMRPIPQMPSALPLSSVPAKALRFHSPPFMDI